MTTEFAKKRETDFQNNTHIEHKKKVLSKKLNRQTDETKSFEYGLDDKDELRNYKHLIR
jgi:hypothetical protein